MFDGDCGGDGFDGDVAGAIRERALETRRVVVGDARNVGEIE